MERIQNFIDGRFVEPASAAVLDNVDPSTGSVYGSIPDSDDRDVDRAVQAARTALPGWASTPAAERSRVLCRLADLIEENLERLARAECVDNG
ncbi:MAG: aldehyde dehydrogenase family protein, partial [Planctomycetota bacterium]